MPRPKLANNHHSARLVSSVAHEHSGIARTRTRHSFCRENQRHPGDAMINASIKDVIDKLARDKKLLEAKAIGDVTADATAKLRALRIASMSAVVAAGVSTAGGEASRVAADADTAYDAQRTFVLAAEVDMREERAEAWLEAERDRVEAETAQIIAEFSADRRV